MKPTSFRKSSQWPSPTSRKVWFGLFPTPLQGPCKPLPSRPPRGNDGFSLVEVSLALGIIAIAFVALLGLIPIGLGTSSNAIDATVQTQVVQRVTTIARQTKFSELSKLDRNSGQASGQESPDFFFDEQGNEVLDSAAIAAGGYVYTAAAVLIPISRLPDGTAEQSKNPNLATLNIIIKRVSAVRDARTVSVLIANNGL